MNLNCVGNMCAVSCAGIASCPDFRERMSNYQGSTSLNNSIIGRPKKKVTFIDDSALCSLRIGGRMCSNPARNAQGFMNFQQPWEDEREGRYFSLNLGKSVRQRSFSSDDVPSDTESLHSVQSLLDGIILRSSSADGIRKRPSRRVICRYIEKSPNVEKNRKKTPKTVISQAVFPDENNPLAATTVLRLKKNKRCLKCQRNTTLCACKLEELRIANEKSKGVDKSSSEFKNASVSGSLSFSSKDPGKPPVSQLTVSTANCSLQKVRTNTRKSDDDKVPNRNRSSYPASTNYQASKINVLSTNRYHDNEKTRQSKPPSNQINCETKLSASASTNYQASRPMMKVPTTNQHQDHKKNRQFKPFSNHVSYSTHRSQQKVDENSLASRVVERFVPIQVTDNYQQRKVNQHHPTPPTRPNFVPGKSNKPSDNISSNHLANLTTRTNFTQNKPKLNPDLRPHIVDEKKSHIQSSSQNLFSLRNIDALPEKKFSVPSQRFPQSVLGERHGSGTERRSTGTVNGKIQRSFRENIVTEPKYVHFENKPISTKNAPNQAGSLPKPTFSSRVVLSLRPPIPPRKAVEPQSFHSVVELAPNRQWQNRNVNFSNNCAEELKRKRIDPDEDEKDPHSTPNVCNVQARKLAEKSSKVSDRSIDKPDGRQTKCILMYENTTTRKRRSLRKDFNTKTEMSGEINGSVITTPVERNGDNGVVEAPTMKVKEIRNKYKVRDYENYATPKIMKNPGGKQAQNEEGDLKKNNGDPEMNEDDASEHEVAQQVMSLFQGALDVEKELEALELDNQAEKEEAQRAKEPTSPSEQNGHVIPITFKEISKLDEATEENSQSQPPASKPTSSPDPEKAPLSETEVDGLPVASFDESLDQFYDVLNVLSA